MFHPFSSIKYCETSFFDKKAFKKKEDYFRYGQLTALMDTVGFENAKRYLNSSKHFGRDYSKFYEEDEADLDLDSVLYRDLTSFFGPYLPEVEDE